MPATITSVKRQLVDQGSISTSGGITETVYYIVTVTEEDAHPWEVCQAVHASMPVLGAQHESLSAAVLSKTATRMKGTGPQPPKTLWQVTLSYGSLAGSSGGPTGDSTNSRNISISVSGVQSKVFTMNAQNPASDGIQKNLPVRNRQGFLNGRPIGERHPTGLELTLYDESIVIAFEPKITANFSMSSVAEARGTINDAEVTMTIPQGSFSLSRTFAKHTLLFDQADYSIQYSKTNPTDTVFNVTIGLLYRFDTWDTWLPNLSHRMRKTADGKLGEYNDRAEFIDLFGVKLGDGLEVVKVGPYQGYREANLTSLLGGI